MTATTSSCDAETCMGWCLLDFNAGRNCDQISAQTEEDYPYECPDCGERHDGRSTGTELCPGCQAEHDNRESAAR